MDCQVGNPTFSTGVSIALVIKRLALSVWAEKVQSGHRTHYTGHENQIGTTND